MNNLFTKEWCRLTWQVLLYLEAAYDKLEAMESLLIIDSKKATWANTWQSDEDDYECSIGFKIKPSDAKRKRDYIWIGLWLTEECAKGDRPIWIQVLRDDHVWDLIKAEFSEELLDDEEWAVGLNWHLPENASNEEVKSAGEGLAVRIIKVFEKIYPNVA